jgi:hypothetical protein
MLPGEGDERQESTSARQSSFAEQRRMRIGPKKEEWVGSAMRRDAGRVGDHDEVSSRACAFATAPGEWV